MPVMTMKMDEKRKNNINEPGNDVEEERPYYDDESEREEQEKVPVEYLGFLAKQKESRREQLVFWILLLIIVFGLAPGTRGRDYCPRSGEWRDHFTFAWGKFDYVDPVVGTTGSIRPCSATLHLHGASVTWVGKCRRILFSAWRNLTDYSVRAMCLRFRGC